jgi:GNAT superfamily N-acetyltransferase
MVVDGADVFPLTRERWADFERLFGPRGACGGCWCMWWRLTNAEMEAGKGEGNRLRQKGSVEAGRVPGLLAYLGGLPAGWIAVEPRREYPRLARSRVLAPLDEVPVWSVTCFFVDRRYRNQGLTVALLKAAVEHVARQGGRVVEGYPIEPRQPGKSPPVFVYTGLVSAFLRAGFKEAARRSPTRPIMRLTIH